MIHEMSIRIMWTFYAAFDERNETSDIDALVARWIGFANGLSIWLELTLLIRIKLLMCGGTEY